MTTTEVGSDGMGSAQGSRRTQWGAVMAVMLGTFVLVTAEQLPIGLLTALAGDLRVTEGVAGLSVTVPSVVAAVAAIGVPLVVGRLDRRVLLIALMVLMTAANAVTAVAPNIGVLVASRVLVGIAIGGFWAVAGSLAVRLAAPESVHRATAVIFGGVAAANVLGVPLATVLGELIGWRLSFAALGALALITMVALIALLPRLAADRPVGLGVLGSQLAHRGVLAGLAITLLAVVGHFAAFTFVSPILQEVSGVPERLVGPVLLAFGVAGMIGNFVAGTFLARHLRGVVIGVLGGMTVMLVAMPTLGLTPVRGVAVLVLWGLVFGGLSVAMQTWMISAAPDSPEPATALWVCIWNAAIGIGAFLGGRTVDTTATAAVPWIGAGVLLLAALIATFARPSVKSRQRQRRDAT
ncbi:MFS transporter [Kribbella sancticallisti]|uniref:MFS transporter n=1 Tax=Kribbella sancticallisti TaxID=460087 RepID=A0ABP4PTR1_9ACTN